MKPWASKSTVASKDQDQNRHHNQQKMDGSQQVFNKNGGRLTQDEDGHVMVDYNPVARLASKQIVQMMQANETGNIPLDIEDMPLIN